MYNLGKTIDRILEQLKDGKKVDVNYLKKNETYAAVLDFMRDCRLIEIENGEVTIAKFGSELLAVN